DINRKMAYYLTRKVPLHDQSGQVTGMLGISIDITERKLAEQAALEAKKQAERAQYLAEAANRTKTEFLANMSHDIKSPMSGIVNFAQLMADHEEWRTPEKARQICSSAEKVLNFFNSCLELSKLETSELHSSPEPFSLIVLLNEIHTMFIPRAQSKSLDFYLFFETNLPHFFVGHRGGLYRVILNLVGNAVKFTHKGEVNIRVFIAEYLQNQEFIIGIEIKDTGPGIPPDQHDRIFEKLQRLTPSYEGKVEGNGIGLYIVKEYLAYMQARITVQSQIDHGSVFTVFVPLLLASESDLSENERCQHVSSLLVAPPKENVEKPLFHSQSNLQQTLLSQKAPLVLLVEDDSMIQMATCVILNKSGFRVDVASTGEQAIQLFDPNKYAYIYLDLGLPDMTGYEICHRIRQREQALNSTVNTPIIALTAHAAVDVESFCANAGMQAVLSKPVTDKKIRVTWERYGKGNDVTIPELSCLDDFVAIF
ncbi:MAG: ATP-binding protein, partial [Gammaproteobacteria bacterium]|nr:ATP-binding protein [Gammaproteobacteria bacterium]